MNRSTVMIAGLSLVAGLAAAPAPVWAQAGKPKPATKPTAAKPAAKPTSGPVVLGTTQMPGDFGQFGTTYTVGKSYPINSTRTRAEYTVTPFRIGNNTWVPTADEKLLILHYTVHNPVQREQGYTWSDLRFTAVDGTDTNHDFIQCVAREGMYQPLAIRLKPAQKIDAWAAILVPAAGVVPKLIVERERNAPVIRYDLRGKVRPLTGSSADPADAEGATARKEVPAQAGAFYPLGVFEARLDEVGYTEQPLARREPGADKRFVTAVFTIRNATQADASYTWSDFLPELKDADGEKAPYTQALLKASRDEKADGTLAPGEEARVRFFFPLPKTVDAKTLALAEGKKIDARRARVFRFNLSTAAKQTAQQ
jgi:hypothetical protein